MPPRKAAAATDDNATADPPRRSGRIASQPVTENPKPKPKATKKRTAGDEAKDGEGSTTKKVPQLFFFFQFLFFFRGYLIYYDFYFLLQAKPDPESAGEAGDSSALSLIDIGGNLPELTLKNEKGEDIQVANLASEKGVILFLVPKADTRESKKKKQSKSTMMLIPVLIQLVARIRRVGFAIFTQISRL